MDGVTARAEDGSRIQTIAEAEREILVLTTPALVRGWSEEQTSALARAARGGLTVKVYLTHRSLFPVSRLPYLRRAGVEFRFGSIRWLGVDSATEEEIWIFDRERALGGTRNLCPELRDQPPEGRISVECEFARAPAKTAARYFDHRWEGHPDGVALVVRHQEFSFRGGKGAERDFLVYASRARREISLCLTDLRISSRLFRCLLEAQKRGVQVRIYGNTFGIRALRSRLLLGRLLRAGVELRFTAGHMPLDSVCAMMDGNSVYLGALPGSVRGWQRIPRPVFFLHDKEMATALRSMLDRQLGNRVSRENSIGLLTSSPSL